MDLKPWMLWTKNQHFDTSQAVKTSLLVSFDIAFDFFLFAERDTNEREDNLGRVRRLIESRGEGRFMS
jgi:hypothetical protein